MERARKLERDLDARNALRSNRFAAHFYQRLKSSDFIHARSRDCARFTRESNRRRAGALMSADGSFFRARRTDARGEDVFDTMPEGHYALGVSAEDFEYREVTVTTSVAPAAEFILGPDANRGRWSVLGNTDPEHFGRTNSGVLLPTGRIIYCHDTF